MNDTPAYECGLEVIDVADYGLVEGLEAERQTDVGGLAEPPPATSTRTMLKGSGPCSSAASEATSTTSAQSTCTVTWTSSSTATTIATGRTLWMEC